jgi:hypothetical protein
MPLLDHFRPPLSTRRHWHAFHNSWATYLAAALNRQLPEGYFAEADVQFGVPAATGGDGAHDQVEVLVYRESDDLWLTGAVELVCPGNKQQTAARESFVSRCLRYIDHSVGVVVVDVVTDPQANLHAELLTRLDRSGMTPEPELYAVAYHPTERGGTPRLDIWVHSLAIGEEVRPLPLWLPGGRCLPVDLEETYTRTCQEQRVIANGA